MMKQTGLFILLIIVIFVYGKKNLAKSTQKLSKIATKQILKNDTISSSPITWNISTITWNLAEKSPSMNDCRFIRELSMDSDLMVIGIQECEDIRPRRKEGRRSRAWKILQDRMLGDKYKCIAQHRMGGLQLALYGKPNVTEVIEGYQIVDVACGLGNVLTNKGAICMILRVNGKSVGFINAHLAAHQNKIKERNADYKRIMDSIVDKAQTKWLTKIHAENKKYRKRYEQDKQSLFGSSILSSSQPLIDQVFASVGLGSATDITTAVSNSRDYRFSKLSDEGFDEVNILGKRPIVKGLENKNSKTLNQRKPKSSLSNDRYDGKIIKRKLPTINHLLRQHSMRRIDRKNIFGKKILSATPIFDGLVFLGDLNYRLDIPRLEVESFKELVHPSVEPVLQAKTKNSNITRKKDQSTKQKSVKSSSKSTNSSRQSEKLSKESKNNAIVKITDIMDAKPMKRLDLQTSSIVLNDPTKLPKLNKELDEILKFDQLRRQMYTGKAFHGFQEGDIHFIPSFKYDKNSDRFDSSGKSRSPAWTDRILYAIHSDGKSSSILNDSSNVKSDRNVMLELKEYNCVDSRHSDHRPVYAKFQIRI